MDSDLKEAADIREYFEILKYRRWTVVLVTVIVFAGVLSFSFLQTPMYLADTRLLVRGIPQDASGYIPPANLSTEAELVASEPVATKVIGDLNLRLSVESVLDPLTVEPVAEQTEVLELQYTSPTPHLASDIVNSFADNYIELKRERGSRATEEGRALIQNRIDAANDRFLEVTKRLEEARRAGSASLAETFQTERNVLIARLGVLAQRLDDYEVTRPTNLSGGEVIEPAAVPSSPSSPDHVTNGVLGLILGLAFGIAIAFLRERFDDRFRGREDVSRALEAPVLATVPRFSPPKNQEFALAVDVDPNGHASEAYRNLRTGVEFILTKDKIRSVLITSASAGEGKTITSANMAVACAQAGMRVIVLSADLRRPSIAKYFGIQEAGRGLSTWLLSREGLEELPAMLKDPNIPNLRVLPSGDIPHNPAELLATPRLSDLIGFFEANADLVIIDSPPTLPIADPIIIASKVGGTIVVIDGERTRRSAAVHAREEIQRVGGRIIGAVLNAVEPSGSAYYRYYTYYGTPEQSTTRNGDGRHPNSRRRSRSSASDD